MGIVNNAGVSSDICPIELFTRDYSKVYEVSPIIHTYDCKITVTYTKVDDNGVSCTAANISARQLFWHKYSLVLACG